MSFSTVQMVMWFEVMFDHVWWDELFISEPLDTFCQDPSTGAKFVLKSRPEIQIHFEQMTAIFANGWLWYVVVGWSLQKLSKTMQFSTCWGENLCIFPLRDSVLLPLQMFTCYYMQYYFIFDKFEIWQGPRAIMGLFRASYDCICWVYNLKQFGDLLICWRPGDSIRLGRGRGNEVPKPGHVLQTSTYYKTYEERMHMLKNVLWHLLEISCSYFAL